MDLEKKATSSLVCGIIAAVLGFLGLFVFGFFEIAALILGIIAIVNGAKSKSISGKGTAGFILGIISVIISSIGVIIWIYGLIILAIAASML